MDTKHYRLIVTAGPTREWIDPVRFLSNPATGQTGWQLAHAGLHDFLFKEVIYIHGACAQSYNEVEGATNICVDTTQEMAQAVQKSICSKSILFMTAAPADYTPIEYFKQKKRKKDKKGMDIQLKPTIDILKSIDKMAPDFDHLYRVGFAAQTDHVEEYAQIKMKEKGLDFICANQVYKTQIGFGEHENTLTVLGHPNSKKVLGPSLKKVLAKDLLAYILAQIS